MDSATITSHGNHCNNNKSDTTSDTIAADIASTAINIVTTATNMTTPTINTATPTTTTTTITENTTSPGITLIKSLKGY
jgi:hypothetical protein